MCDYCQRTAAHKDHKWDVIIELAGAERARITAVKQRCAALGEQLHTRGIALSNAGKGHTQSAHAAEQDIQRVAEELKAAIDARAAELLQEARQFNQVYRSCLHRGPGTLCTKLKSYGCQYTVLGRLRPD